LGDACALLGESGRARAAYAKALDRDPSDIATLLALARLEEAEGDRAAAASSYRRALAVDPDHPGAHASLSGLLEAEGDLEGAVYHLWRARDLDPAAARASDDETRRRLLDLYR